MWADVTLWDDLSVVRLSVRPSVQSELTNDTLRDYENIRFRRKLGLCGFFIRVCGAFEALSIFILRNYHCHCQTGFWFLSEKVSWLTCGRPNASPRCLVNHINILSFVFRFFKMLFSLWISDNRGRRGPSPVACYKNCSIYALLWNAAKTELNINGHRY